MFSYSNSSKDACTSTDINGGVTITNRVDIESTGVTKVVKSATYTTTGISRTVEVRFDSPFVEYGPAADGPGSLSVNAERNGDS